MGSILRHDTYNGGVASTAREWNSTEWNGMARIACHEKKGREWVLKRMVENGRLRNRKTYILSITPSVYMLCFSTFSRVHYNIFYGINLSERGSHGVALSGSVFKSSAGQQSLHKYW